MLRSISSRFYLLGSLFVGVGLAGDILAGLITMNQQVWVGLFLHGVACLIWILGVVILDGGNIFSAAVSGFLMFPGVGTFGWTLASALAGVLYKRTDVTASVDIEVNPVDPLAHIRNVIETSPLPSAEAVIQPLVETPYISDSRFKRAALNLVCREPSSQAKGVVSAFLADSDPDVRALAAVAASRLEGDWSEWLQTVIAQIQLDARNAEYHALLGELYYFGYSGKYGSDPNSRDFYLSQARKAFETAISLDPSENGYRIELTEILINLGDYQKAWDILAPVIDKGPEDAKCYFLGLEIALRMHRFDQIHLLAERAYWALPESGDARSVMMWWLENVKEHYDAKNPEEIRERGGYMRAGRRHVSVRNGRSIGLVASSTHKLA